MARLMLSLLGPFHITLDNRTVSSFAYDKVRALLAYLVVEADRPHRREALAELLWPDQPAATARHNLSQALTTLRQALDDHHATPPYLLITRGAVQFHRASDHVADVADFTTLINACSRHTHTRRETCSHCAHQLEQAVALYRGDFLAQVMIGDSSAFEEWAVLRREWLRQRALDALSWLSEYYEQRGAYEQAIAYVQRQITLDPWQEEAHRRSMRVLARNGQRAAALRQYEQCRRALAGELGIEPDEETTALYEQIRKGTFPRTALARHAEHSAAVSTLRRHNLPAQTTPFVGREGEVADIRALLSAAHCRLITLVGPGGIGKTRLGLHVARSQIDALAHGICFVPLAPLGSARQIVAAVADALQLQFFGQDDPLDQLCAYLHDKQMLLVLDNVEHLLDGADVIVAILRSVPEVRILATSRERLNLHGEWVYEVEGLGVPARDTLDEIEHYSAVQLFVQSARRVQSHFELRTEDRRCVVRICRLAGGMPLAIELAAAWVMVLPCMEIAREIENNLDFLTTSTRDLPARHRSMRAVFDHSWSLLGERERHVFPKLSVFRGGFTRAAAEEVADASLASLAALVAKSLLHRTPDGRYEIHELLRQYGGNKLSQIPEEEQQTRARHCEYYLHFLAQREMPLKGHDQQALLREIASEIENVRAAWQWAAERRRADLIIKAAEALWFFYVEHSRFHECEEVFGSTVRWLEQPAIAEDDHAAQRALALGKALAFQGSQHIRLGSYVQGRTLLDRSISLLRRLDAQREVGLGLNFLAAIMHLQGAYDDEQHLLQESIALAQSAGDRWLTAYSLNDLGLCTHLLGDASGAQRLCGESLRMFQEIDDRRGMAFALNNLGVVAHHLGDYGAAEQLYRESLALRRANGDQWGVASALIRLGIVARARGDMEGAKARFLEAMQTAHAVRVLPVVLDALVELAAVLTSEGSLEQAGDILRFSVQHPALSKRTAEKAEQLLREMLAHTTPGAVMHAHIAALSVEAFISALLDEHSVEG